MEASLAAHAIDDRCGDAIWRNGLTFALKSFVHRKGSSMELSFQISGKSNSMPVEMRGGETVERTDDAGI